MFTPRVSSSRSSLCYLAGIEIFSFLGGINVTQKLQKFYHLRLHSTAMRRQNFCEHGRKMLPSFPARPVSLATYFSLHYHGGLAGLLFCNLALEPWKMSAVGDRTKCYRKSSNNSIKSFLRDHQKFCTVTELATVCLVASKDKHSWTG